jgi:hypothetical protein
MEACIQLSSVTSYSFKASTRTFVPVPRIYFCIKCTYLTLQFQRICSQASGLFSQNINYYFDFQVTLELLIINLFIYLFIVDQDISVGITPRYGFDGPRVKSRCAARFAVPVQTGPGSHRASYTIGTEFLCRGLKRPGRGFDHPPYLAPRIKKG